MKKIFVLTVTVFLILFAGCTTASPGSSGPGAVPNVATLPTYTVPADALPMNASVSLGNATHGVSVSVDSFELNPQSDGKTTVTIYVAAKNTGKDPIKFVWFSKLTDLNGNSYGGIGLSHAGNGARPNWILPNNSEAARDYVVVDSSQELAALAKGAVLDVYFVEQKVNVTPTLIPDYHVTWVIDPGTIG
jgi:hypothetical protein